jgi:chromosome segregation ATPase
VQVWAKANQDVSIESDRMISKVLSEAEERCQSLQEEVRCLRDQLQCSDIQLRDSANNMAELDHAFMDVAREINARHHDEIAQMSDERKSISCENERLQSLLQRAETDIASKREELAELKSRYRVIEVKSLEQEGVIRSLHQTKTETTHRCADFQSCMQLLERQVADLKSENSSLTKAVEQKNAIIVELKAENKELSVKNTSLKQQVAIQSDKVDELQNECAQLRREYTDATEQIAWLEREKRRCVQELERQKEDQLKQLTEALGVMGKKSQDKQDPVVVHLHGNDNNENQRRSADAINECHHLRQRLLELQRSNIRLESDLVEAKQAARAHNQYVNRADVSDVQQLTQENNSLKQIITMMRAEMESVSKLSPASKEEGEAVELPHAYTLALDQQLTHMKAYLDIMLKSSRCNDNTAEIHFLRSRYKELHDVLDQVREENLR